MGNSPDEPAISNKDGSPIFNQHEQKLHDTACLAQELVAGILGFDAALTILNDPRSDLLIPPIEPGQLVSGGVLEHLGRSDGHNYHFTHYLGMLRTEPSRTRTQRLWASSALVLLGDDLARHGYFERDPALELVRHLRNATAHGERFSITNPDRLQTFPAFLQAGVLYWEITPSLDGTCLYDFVAPGDIASIIQQIGIQLNNEALARHVQA